MNYLFCTLKTHILRDYNIILLSITIIILFLPLNYSYFDYIYYMYIIF